MSAGVRAVAEPSRVNRPERCTPARAIARTPERSVSPTLTGVATHSIELEASVRGCIAYEPTRGVVAARIVYCPGFTPANAKDPSAAEAVRAEKIVVSLA